MIVIDGSEGEGGGQVLRTALALSLVTGKPFRIENIRANARGPGSCASMSPRSRPPARSAAPNARSSRSARRELTFAPGKVKPGEHRFAVGTAGSTSLVLQTSCRRSCSRTRRRGSCSRAAPTISTRRRSTSSSGSSCRSLNRMGPRSRRGWSAPASIRPAAAGSRSRSSPAPRWRALDLLERGALARRRRRARSSPPCPARSPCASSRRSRSARLAGGGAAHRAASRAIGPGQHPDARGRASSMPPSSSAASASSACRRRAVGEKAAKRMAGYLASSAVAGPYLADQLLLPDGAGRRRQLHHGEAVASTAAPARR